MSKDVDILGITLWWYHKNNGNFGAGPQNSSWYGGITGKVIKSAQVWLQHMLLLATGNTEKHLKSGFESSIFPEGQANREYKKR